MDAVDNEKSLADLFADLYNFAYPVHNAYDGNEALDQISDEIDVVLLFRQIPNLSGKDGLENILEAGYACQVAMVAAVTPDIDIVEIGYVISNNYRTSKLPRRRCGPRPIRGSPRSTG